MCEMKTMRLLAAFCLISMTMAIAIATDETIELGSARISMDLSRLGSYSIEKGDLSSMDHKKPDFQYEITPARINVEGTLDQVQLEVHQMSMSEPLESSISNKDSASGLEHCIERSSLVPVGEDIQTEPYTIDGHQGKLATLNGDPENPLYIVAYSPDQKDGLGTVVCIVSSDFSWEATKRLFDSIKTEVV
jgi:hypothetical protein